MINTKNLATCDESPVDMSQIPQISMFQMNACMSYTCWGKSETLCK